MKALIIAAGRGKRLEPYTKTYAKPLVPLNNTCMFENTIKHLKALACKEIASVVGYKKELFLSTNKYKDIKFYENPNWENNNILHSLFCARDFLDDDIIISYGDIFFEKEPFEKLKEEKKDIVLAVDTLWEEYYINRSEHPISQAENVHFSKDLKLKKIGKHIYKSEDKSYEVGEFMGLMKLSKNIVKAFVKEFENLEKTLDFTKPFMQANTFLQAYLTDYIQYLLDEKADIFDITCSLNEKGWSEVDTKQDFENLIKRIENVK